MNSMDELPAFPEGWYFVTSREPILREKLKVYETREILGLVFAWFGRDGRLPHVHPVGPVTVDGAYLKNCRHPTVYRQLSHFRQSDPKPQTAGNRIGPGGDAASMPPPALICRRQQWLCAATLSLYLQRSCLHLKFFG